MASQSPGATSCAGAPRTPSPPRAGAPTRAPRTARRARSCGQDLPAERSSVPTLPEPSGRARKRPGPVPGRTTVGAGPSRSTLAESGDGLPRTPAVLAALGRCQDVGGPGAAARDVRPAPIVSADPEDGPGVVQRPDQSGDGLPVAGSNQLRRVATYPVSATRGASTGAPRTALHARLCGQDLPAERSSVPTLPEPSGRARRRPGVPVPGRTTVGAGPSRSTLAESGDGLPHPPTELAGLGRCQDVGGAGAAA